MAEIDANKFMLSKYEALLQETTEVKMFKLGVCYGYFQLYRQICQEYDIETADKCFANTFKDENFSDFLTMVQIYKTPNKFERLLEKLRYKKDNLDKDEVDMVSEFANFLYKKGVKKDG